MASGTLVRYLPGVRLIHLKIHEPLPWPTLPICAEPHGAIEAARRYRAVAVTTLRQLKGLERARIRLRVEPEDAHEAVRFWLLPRLAGKWHADGGVYRSEGWEIEFGTGDARCVVEARGEILCPYLSARWVHAAMIGLERGQHRVEGPADDGSVVFRAAAAGTDQSLEVRKLPPLPVIRNHAQWTAALDGPLGPALKKAWEEEA